MKIKYYERPDRPGIWMSFKDAMGNRRRIPTGKLTRAEAERAAPALLAAALTKVPDNGTVAQPGVSAKAAASSGWTLRTAYKHALAHREQWIRSKDKKTLEQTFESILASTDKLTEDTDMGMLTRDFVRELRAQWLKEPGKRKGSTLAASTVNHRLSMLSVLLEVCDLPPHTVKHLSTRGNRRKRRISDGEIKAMQSWLLTNHHRKGALSMVDLITVGIEQGARQDEYLSLEWRDVSFETRMLTFRDTKNYETRTIPMTATTALVLERRRHLATPFADLDQDRVTALWDAARAAIGLAADEEFVYHSLRHEFASRLSDRRVNGFTIQALMGHADISTTQVYVKASMGAMGDALGVSPVSAMLPH
jgi:integrase